MPDINWNILTPAADTNPVKSSMGGQAPQAPQQSSGGLLGGLTGEGLAGLKQLFGSNPVSTATSAINSQMQNIPAPDLAKSLLGSTALSGMQQKVSGSIQAPQAPIPPQPMQSQGILANAPPAAPISSTGFDTKNHVLTDISDPKVQGNAIHSAVEAAGQPNASPFDVAQSYVGQGRKNGADTMEGFFKKSLGQNIDIQTTPWCAAFANSVLASTGHGQTGSLSARSFRTYGQATSTPSKGDIVVMSRGSNQDLGHVGFFAGYSDDHTKVKVLAGNTSGQVMIKEYPLNSVLDYRVPPTSKELQAKAQNPNATMASNSPTEGPIHQPISKYTDQSLQTPVIPHEQYESTTRDMDQGRSYAYNAQTGKYA